MGIYAKRGISVVIAEKSPLLQASLVGLFAEDPRFCQVRMTSDGQDFVDAVMAEPFDVGVIGWEMPNLDGRGVLQALRGVVGAPRVVVYTGSANADLPRQAMTLGAAAFCSKSDQPEQLLDVIVAVSAGRMAFPFIDVSSLARDPLTDLTSRERDMLATLTVGYTNQQIASQLDISLNTVKFHLKNLYDKLGVASRAQAVAFYLTECHPR
ncbi:MAG: response regulator transcription factor [Magnetospirillum sp.]|nr:MAG: response regulator transcription factor [Magnetospirillum sp.]